MGISWHRYCWSGLLLKYTTHYLLINPQSSHFRRMCARTYSMQKAQRSSLYLSVNQQLWVSKADLMTHCLCADRPTSLSAPGRLCTSYKWNPCISQVYLWVTIFPKAGTYFIFHFLAISYDLINVGTLVLLDMLLHTWATIQCKPNCDGTHFIAVV